MVICTYSEARWHDLVRAVQSVQQQTCRARELIIVVDHNPHLLTRIRQEFGAVTVVENRQAPGLSGARNTGLASSTASVIAFLDDDASAAPDWVERLMAGYQDARVMGVGGYVEPVWETSRPRWFPPEFDWVVGCSYAGLPKKPSEVRNLLGCNMSFRRDVFDGVGGFRTGIGRIGAYPVGCEETELCIRASQAWPERSFRYEPGARVTHQVPAARATWTYFRSRCYAEGSSKALISHFIGTADGLASERRHTLRTLPSGVARELARVLLRRDLAGLARAAAIVGGLAFTAAGFVAGSWGQRQEPIRTAIEASREARVG